MNIGVVGLWHLGSVTAACLAGAGFTVTGYDEDASTVVGLRQGRPPLFEPGLEQLLRAGLDSRRLRITSRPEDLADAEVIWVAYDTPVDDDDNADVELVIRRVCALMPALARRAIVLVSSQVPAGSTRRLEDAYRKMFPEGRLAFAYSPENLRLGKAIDAFTKPERVVVGVRTGEVRSRLEPVFRPFTERVEWMGVEAAEMTKHAINAFLATSVAFMNELSGLCERVGADAREVERGLKSEGRIGPRAYLRPGAAFAGGTLARDIAFIEAMGRQVDRPTPLFSSVRASNDAHKQWPARRLAETLGKLSGERVAVLGLTYKPGTDTLRRSSAIELCRWLATQGARVVAFDPVVRALPTDLPARVELAGSAEDALRGASAAVLATEWPDFRRLDAASLVEWMSSPPTVLDAGGFLEAAFANDARIRYLTVGRST
jgi:UDPglucose 6-dehydrogenase